METSNTSFAYLYGINQLLTWYGLGMSLTNLYLLFIQYRTNGATYVDGDCILAVIVCMIIFVRHEGSSPGMCRCANS